MCIHACAYLKKYVKTCILSQIRSFLLPFTHIHTYIYTLIHNLNNVDINFFFLIAWNDYILCTSHINHSCCTAFDQCLIITSGIIALVEQLPLCPALVAPLTDLKLKELPPAVSPAPPARPAQNLDWPPLTQPAHLVIIVQMAQSSLQTHHVLQAHLLIWTIWPMRHSARFALQPWPAQREQVVHNSLHKLVLRWKIAFVLPVEFL